jgi:hypothetical protein
MLSAVEAATVARCNGEAWVHVVVDGTSLRLSDVNRTKDFGGVGSTANGPRGLKVIHAYAVAEDGTPVGTLNQQWWARPPRHKRHDCNDRPLGEKETAHWVRAIEDAARALADRPGPRAWFQVDREGDRFWTLFALHRTSQWFTVRSIYAHRLVITKSGRQQRLRDAARKGRLRGIVRLELPARPKRAARQARLRIRTTEVTLDMIEAHSGEALALPINVVDVGEIGPRPRGELPIHWRLLTNHPIGSMEDVLAIIDWYTKRWRIEELHRVWKSGALRVEETQLRSSARVIKSCDTCCRDRRTHRTPASARTDEAQRLRVGRAQQARDPSPDLDEASSREANRANLRRHADDCAPRRRRREAVMAA